MNAGVIGSGVISPVYLKNMIEKHDNLNVICIASKHLEHARTRGAEFSIPACSVEEMLENPEVEMVVVLTPVGSHAQLIRDALMHGKHVYTEKAICGTPAEAAELIALAKEKGLYLGAAPDTFLGNSLQTARKALDDGLIGEVTSCVAAANRDNNVLLSVLPFLNLPGAGIVLDYGVYYMTALVSLLGPVSLTAAITRTPFPTHRNIYPQSPDYGKIISTPNESEMSAILQFASGITGTFHLNADSVLQDQANMIIYGTKGMLLLTNPDKFGGQVRLLKNMDSFDYILDGDPEYILLDPVNDLTENCRGVGPAEMAQAIAEGREHRTSAQMAYHVLDVLYAILESDRERRFVEIHSTCSRPEPYRQSI